MSAVLTFEQAEQVLTEEQKLDVMLLVLKQYDQDWDDALLEDVKRTEDKERAFQRAWSEALAYDVQWTANRLAWKKTIDRFWEANEEVRLANQKAMLDPTFRRITYEANEAMKRLRKRKR